ncbi:prepilin-type N-terminal cleavage/methylation domain-containing protein [Idiomarina aquatica]|uniref:Prepilin-type N-terminal cleavage/methylation domain-containing protein n=1 Tax=Idiomarina aquatica TaxID=1327752 RepID=A0A4R6PNS1_9GAMM|nr:prepilin-type N-terminal cleavage/methylation domain-containing protein [Idiomarina aquatica]TDP40232.1 prepilin-type N-terminal cleavage/methylation domain-containing protein [Idiomarina aquatica]
MTYRFKAGFGFTLLELLTTLAIAGTAMALVAPLAVEQVSKMEARAEASRLNDQIGRWSFMAFSRGCPISLDLAESVITISSEGCDFSERITHEYISFPHQVIKFSSSGFTDVTRLSYNYDGSVRQVDFEEALVNQTAEVGE